MKYLIAIIFFSLAFTINSLNNFKDKEEIGQEESHLNDTTAYISIKAVGDIMIGSTYPNALLPANDASNYFDVVKSILSSADLTFGNLEGTLFNGIGKVKRCSDPKICYAFKMPEHYVNHFKIAGFDWFSIANNHIGDFGTEGILSTIRVLNDAEIKFAGVKSYPYTLDTVKGIKLAFTAFAPNNESLNINDYEYLDSIVRYLDTISDIVVVSFHGGAEGRKFKNITQKDEIFLEERRGNPHKFARIAIDAGADLILGHGPHVTRAIDIYKNRFIAYSLGNFATYGRFNIKNENGIAPILKIRINNKGEFQDASVVSIKQVGKGIPKIDSTHKAFREIINLTQTDFPDNSFIFDTVTNRIRIKQ